MEYKVDLSKATIGDLFDAMESPIKMLNFYEKVVEGGVRDISLMELPAIGAAVSLALEVYQQDMDFNKKDEVWRKLLNEDETGDSST
jgi:hypothetical protein